MNNEQSINNYDSSRNQFVAALNTQKFLNRIGYALICLLTISFGAALYFFGIELLVITLLTIISAALITLVVKKIVVFPLIAFPASKKQFPAIQDAFNRKIAHSSSVRFKDGNVTHLVDERNEHLAITGYFVEKDIYVIWIFGKGWFLKEVEDYITNSK